MFSKLLDFVKNNKRILFILYFPIYMLWFNALEAWKDRDFTILSCGLDEATPFVSVFIIPYMLWFAFVIFFCVFFFVKMPVEDTVKMYSALVIGMTTTLIIYTVWPNALELRPDRLNGEDIFSKIVAKLYSMDTDTNVCPSIHVLNTLIITVAYLKTEFSKKRYLLNTFIIVFAASICFSTVFLKQHSYIDVFAAFALCAVVCMIVYIPKWNKKKTA